ncbi:hypothetical protein AGDE_12684 [Angomonas deanei]|uniref:Uncharacterized protein n=1 Tax=Angomonas deanei TaxID=59799 RepID=A0A7G2C5U2_9TRYP|nr:hypothetical protein AGDE_12684 [Angomonas deanei]CAD2215120.1 hypothetical protein, conserved [Angomonas deanei]|eukprot:EPY23999.1 hypothetical protein AGDE_12684 [Angomonas deanei]
MTSGGAAFSAEELGALQKAWVATPPAIIPQSDNIFVRLEKTFESPLLLSDVGAVAMRVTVLGAQAKPNCQTVMKIVENTHEPLDKAIESHRQQLAKSQASRQFLSSFVLLLMMAAEECLAVEPLMELFKNSVATVIHVVSDCLQQVVDRSGVPHLELPRLIGLGANCMDIVREITSWKVYEMTLTEEAATDVPMKKLYKEFKQYIGSIIGTVTQTRLFVNLSFLYGSLPGGVRLAEGDRLVRSSLLLLENLLTFTDCRGMELRRSIRESTMIPNLCGYYLSNILLTPGDLRTFVCNVCATLCFSDPFFQKHFSTNQVITSAIPGMQFSPAVPGRDASKVEAVAQLVRLVINGHITSVLTNVLQVWKQSLNEEEQQAMANLLANPSRRRQPVDVHSPAYAPLRDVFKIAGIPSFVIQRHERNGRGIQKRRGRRGGGRGRGGGGRGRGRGHGKGRGRFGGRRGLRQRRKNRYAVLRSAQRRGPQSEEERRLAILSSDTSSSSGSSDEEEEEGAPTAAPSNTVDLSKWRWGTPPEGNTTAVRVRPVAAHHTVGASHHTRGVRVRSKDHTGLPHVLQQVPHIRGTTLRAGSHRG